MKAVKSRGGLTSAPFEPADATAVQAVFEGHADEAQQMRAMRWILESACAIHEMSYDPESDRATSFNEGKRFVGKQIAELLRTNVQELIKMLRRNHEAA